MTDPVSLDQAIAMVDAWGPEFGFQLHEIARALREGYRHRENDAEGWHRGWLQQKERADAAVAELRHLIDTRLTEEEATALVDERDRLQADYAKLDYQTRMMGVSLADKPDGYGSPREAYPLSRCLDLMDAWREGVECWGLHQMCRVLRQVWEMVAADAEAARRELSDIHRTFDLRWKADQRAIKRWQTAHPGRDLVWPDHADMVVWLLDQVEADRARDRLLDMWIASEDRVLASIPCARARDDCSGRDYPYAPCCNLRVALLPGEPFPTDYLAESGEVHLFEPTVPEYPGAPRRSAGCVKLIEPTTKGGIEAQFDMTAVLMRRDPPLIEPTLDERNETLDWDFKHRYLG